MRLQLVVFAITALAVGAFGHGHHGKFRQAFHHCANTTEVDGEVLKAWVNRQPVDDDRLKCFLACVMKAVGTMNEDGQIIPEKIIAQISMHTHDRETKVESIEICSIKRGKDDCETAFLVATCLRRHHVFDRPHHSQSWKNFQKCKIETKVDSELLRAERRGEDVDDPQVKCFYACMMKRLNIMNDEGKVNVMKLINHVNIPEDDVHRVQKIEMFSTCAKKKGTDECDTAYRIRRCIYKGLTKMFKSNVLPTTTTEAPMRVPMAITSDNE
ncbi:uncharacterized protein [Chelonus insularis]|uniref:uncharacterized protein n=1 Tax=Chelonus insularis TaxID=460826 RepID=UPI00158A194F|nr:uncharacterized protein LOC118070160 [Chelonus insularis]